MTARLAGRMALVTGAASGIGAEIALAFAREGSALALNDRTHDERLERVLQQCRGHGVTAEAAPGDVGEVAGAQRVVDCALDLLGGLDVLVNNAGMLTEAPLLELDVQSWDAMIRVDLRSVYLCTQRAARHMVARRRGRIINVASQLAIKGGEHLSHYCAAKAGVIGFTKSVARELAPHGVLVNAIAPGPVDTPLVAGLSPSWRSAKMAELPLGRFGRPCEVAPTAVLLASEPDGNLYVGQTLGPNSGDVMP